MSFTGLQSNRRLTLVQISSQYLKQSQGNSIKCQVKTDVLGLPPKLWVVMVRLAGSRGRRDRHIFSSDRSWSLQFMYSRSGDTFRCTNFGLSCKKNLLVSRVEVHQIKASVFDRFRGRQIEERKKGSREVIVELLLIRI